jgi:hypothetical protein
MTSRKITFVKITFVEDERSIYPITLNRKNALFAGSDGGAEHWAIIASLIETCKLNKVDPLTYLTDVLTRIVNGHPNSEIDQLLPWAYYVKISKLWPENDAYGYPENGNGSRRRSRAATFFLSGSPCPSGGRTPAAADAPGNRRAPTFHGSAPHPAFQARANCSNFPQQNIAKPNLRNQYGWRRFARS